MIIYQHSEELHNTQAASKVLPFVFELFKPESVVDIGCGTGSWLKIAKQLGARILGIDGLNVGEDLMSIDMEEFIKHDLTSPIKLESRFDLAICLEVVEHLPYTAAESIIDTLTTASDVILFSAAIPGQGGQYHINEQWPEYWQTLFSNKNYFPLDILRSKFWDVEEIDWWYRQNMLIYTKAEIASDLRLEFDKTLKVYIHPELFDLKLIEISEARKLLDIKDAMIRHKDTIIEEAVFHPRFFSSFKRLVKSVIGGKK